MSPVLLRSMASAAALALVSLAATSLGAAPASANASIAAADPAPAISWLGSDFNNSGIGDRGTSNANIDGDGGFLIRDLLPAAGLPSGVKLTLPSDPTLAFVLGGSTPGQPDNVVGTGQTLNTSVAMGSAASTPATTIAFIGAATTSTQSNQQLTLEYSDATQQTIPLTLTDWCSGSGESGNVRFGTVTNRWFNGAEDTGTKCGLWATAPVALTAGKKLDGIVLPVNSRLHVFAIASNAVGGTATLTASGAPSVAPAGGTTADTSVQYGSGAIALDSDVTWAASGVATSYQWSVDGVPVPNATSKAYEPRITDVGKTVTLVATGRKSGYGLPGTATSNPVLVTPGTLVVRQDPSIVGTPRGGATMSVSDGQYSPADADESHHWFAGDRAIDGATEETFTPGADLVGTVVSVITTVTRDGYDSLVRTAVAPVAVAAAPVISGPTPPSPPVVTPVLHALSLPSISGTARVGSLLSAKAPSFAETGVVVHYQWMRAGKPVAGATKATYRGVAGDRTHKLSVVVSGEHVGFLPAAVTSRETSPVAVGIITITKKGRVTGTTKVGSKLTVVAPRLTVSATHTKVRWLRAGKAIHSATSKSYRLVAADRGKKITVRVTVVKTGYATSTTSISIKKVK